MKKDNRDPKEIARERNRKYRAKHKDKIKESNRKYYQKNKIRLKIKAIKRNEEKL